MWRFEIIGAQRRPADSKRGDVASMDLTQDLTLDLTGAYSNAAFIPDGTRYPDRRAAAAQAFRVAVPDQIGLPYGPGRRQAFDLLAPDSPKGTVIFVHRAMAFP